MKYCSSCGEEAQSTMLMCALCGHRTFSDMPSLTSVESISSNSNGSQAQPIQTTATNALSSDLNIVPAGWLEAPSTPWRRYAARLLDLSFLGAIGFFIIGIIFYSVAPYSASQFFEFFMHPSGYILDIIFTAFVGSVLTGAIIGVSGFSLGKILFGIVVTDINGGKLGLMAGVRRDVAIYVRGLALGIPFVSLFTLYASFKRLTATNSTSWDEDNQYKVWHRPSGTPQYILNVIGVIVFFMVTSAVKLLGSY